ncbi:IclR family transcriptional regulator domain-containing protein [Prauserella cavernicola]|uniref:IclR family transcriptional regulator domain-containing protein n=1 Tax=Prauserella cavernicola TaxID=2800127 RepID=UPI001E3EA4D6|nr:IclR family transcriptional regulator C-terminal domain-containing protein [Prauserella cavernicola]
MQQGNRSLTVLREEPAQSLRAGGWVGRSSPMHCTASGRPLLFDSDDDLVEALTADELLAPTHGLAAPRSLDELLDRLHTERQRGYAVASEEVEIGLTSVGVLIRNHAGDLLAVINISGPTSRLIARIDQAAHRLRATATALESTLAQPRPPGAAPRG